MPKFRPERVLAQELLDSAPDPEAVRNLADIARINRWFGGHRILRARLAEAFGGKPFRALDVGAASGDMARAAPPNAHVTCCDLATRNLALAPDPKVAADANALPFPDGSFDIVWCSLFLHHFDDGEVIALVREMRRVSRRYVLLMDLQRHPFAYYFLPATRPLFRWRPITVHDGMLSVQAGFTAQELAWLAARAGLTTPKLRRHWPWHRLSLIASV